MSRFVWADPQELLMLRSLFKGLPSNPEPSLISSALGRYASYLSQAKDTRVNLAEEFFQSALSVSADNPCPRAVHTYHWFLCSQKKVYSSILQYERLRARAPISGQDAAGRNLSFFFTLILINEVGTGWAAD